MITPVPKRNTGMAQAPLGDFIPRKLRITDKNPRGTGATKIPAMAERSPATMRYSPVSLFSFIGLIISSNRIIVISFLYFIFSIIAKISKLILKNF
jgi:hypothetical protein